MPNTKGFRPVELLQHFADHGAEFGLVNVADYARIADEQWVEPKPVHIEQCTRMSGETVRFDPTNDYYCVVDNWNHIKTLFKPVPCATLTPQQRAAMKPGGCHNSVDNLTYFRKSCKR